MNDLELEYFGRDGRMVIHMDEFFPCTKSMLKSLVEMVINHMNGWDAHNKAIDTLKDYFRDQIEICELEMKSVATEIQRGFVNGKKAQKQFNDWEKRKKQFEMLLKYIETVKRW